jgi:hypothetical protein
MEREKEARTARCLKYKGREVRGRTWLAVLFMNSHESCTVDVQLWPVGRDGVSSQRRSEDGGEVLLRRSSGTILKTLSISGPLNIIEYLGKECGVVDKAISSQE